MFSVVQKTICIILLGFVYHSHVCYCTTSGFPFRRLGPYWRAYTYGPSMAASSLSECALLTLGKYYDYSFFYNSLSNTCIIGRLPFKTLALTPASNGDLYINADINVTGCPFSSWIYYTERLCYFLIDVPSTYAEADESCKTMGGFLASAKNEDKLNCFRFSTSKTASYYWAGADDIDVEGTYVWKSDGTTLTSDTINTNFLYPGSLAVYNTSKNCVMYDVANRKLDIGDCNEKYLPLCEWDLWF